MKSLRDSFVQVLQEIGRQDKQLVVLTSDISHFRLQPFAKDCPGRYYNVGICEPTILTMAAGLAKVGFYPVVHSIAPFIVERSYEQLKLDFCYQRLGGTLLTVGSAFDYASLGCTHHCYNDFALLKVLPDTQLFYPASFEEFAILFRAVYHNRSLKYFRLSMFGHEQVFSPALVQVGQGIKIAEGDDVTIVAVGSQLKTVAEALPILKSSGISTEVIYLHTLRPLDTMMILESINKTKRCLVIEEHGLYGGVFDDVTRLAKDLEGMHLASIAVPQGFIREYGTYAQHCQRLGFSVEGIIQRLTDDLALDLTAALNKGNG